MTAPTSDERKAVAARLRQMADRHDVDKSDVIHVFDDDDIRKLADLIDPTCEVESVEPIKYVEFDQTIGYAFHLTCGHCVMRPYTDMPPCYCDECGARVVTDDD